MAGGAEQRRFGSSEGQMAYPNTMLTNAEINRQYDMHDTNGDGVLDRAEFQTALAGRIPPAVPSLDLTAMSSTESTFRASQPHTDQLTDPAQIEKLSHALNVELHMLLESKRLHPTNHRNYHRDHRAVPGLTEHRVHSAEIESSGNWKGGARPWEMDSWRYHSQSTGGVTGSAYMDRMALPKAREALQEEEVVVVALEEQVELTREEEQRAEGELPKVRELTEFAKDGEMPKLVTREVAFEEELRAEKAKYEPMEQPQSEQEPWSPSQQEPQSPSREARLFKSRKKAAWGQAQGRNRSRSPSPVATACDALGARGDGVVEFPHGITSALMLECTAGSQLLGSTAATAVPAGSDLIIPCPIAPSHSERHLATQSSHRSAQSSFPGGSNAQAGHNLNIDAMLDKSSAGSDGLSTTTPSSTPSVGYAEAQASVGEAQAEVAADLAQVASDLAVLSSAGATLTLSSFGYDEKEPGAQNPDHNDLNAAHQLEV